MLIQIAETFASVLTSGPAPALAGGRVGVRRPAGSSDVPAISIGVQIDKRPGLRWDADAAGGAVAGSMPLEIWAASSTAARDLAQALETRIRERRSALRERGFSLLRPLALEPVEDIRFASSTNTGFPVSRQTLSYAFAFQAPPIEEVIEGGPIRQIDVSLKPPADENLTIT